MIVTGWLLAATTRWDAYVYIVSSSTPTNQFAFFENTANAWSPRFSAHLPWSDNNIYRDAWDGATSRLFSTRWWINNKPHMRTLSKSTTNTAQNVKQDIRRNGFTLATSTTTNAIIGNNSQFFLWSNSTPTNYFTGKIAEILVYAGNGGIINKPQQNKIESYLSVKYGITLDQSIAWWQNYILNNNTISWSTGSAGVYNKDIAGITRDDSIGLLQTKSQSINNTEDIIVQKTGLINNNQTLLRWNDGASTSSRTTTELPSGIIWTSRIAREWKFQEKNTDISNVVITYPINTSTLWAWIMSILIDTDGNFTNGWTTEYTGSIVSWHWTFSVNIPDNNVITFAFKKDTYTPWCVNREPWAWYKADDNNYSSISWTDQTTNHRDLDSNWTFFNDPYKTLVNFNPSYDFDSSNYFYYKWDTFSHDSDRWSMRYSVASYQKPVDQFWYLINFTVAGWATENASLLADNNVWKYHSYDTDNAGTTIDVFWTDPFKPKRRVLTSQRFKDDVAISEDWKELDRQSNWLNWSYYNHLSIGIQHDAWGGWKFPWFWQTPEVVLYNDKNPEIDTYNINWDDDERIQTYLAIKYWQTLLHNYIDWYSNTIYDINLWYSNNIFWLWREACEWLYQKQSKSENNNSLVTMFVGSWIADFNEINTWIISNDNSYLIAWDNAWSYDSWSIYWAISWYTMINRKRQTQNSNFIDTIWISVPWHLSSVTNKLAAPITWIVNLIIDNDWDFTDGNSTIYPMTLVGTDWTITWVSLTWVKYYTFASNRIKWDVCIEWPNTFTIGSWIAKSITRQLQAQSNYFKVDDQKGNLSWYYTTLSVSSLTWSNWASIPTSAIQIKADPVTTLSWTYNSSVFVNPTITSYVSAASPVQFLKRNINTGPYTLWTYWSKLWMKINIPAYQSVWTYTGTITYTLYEN